MEKGNRMDKREIAAKITQKKEEIKNLISQDKLEDAKNARKEMQRVYINMQKIQRLGL